MQLTTTLGLAVLTAVFTVQLSVVGQGALTPPGAPAATMKTLDQVQPRTPITALPFTISTSGAYYLTTNVSTLANGITINANDVDVDLGGFAMIGGVGSTAGIFVSGIHTNVFIHDGAIRSFAGPAVNGPSLRGGHFARLMMASNAGGIIAGADASLENCLVVETTGGNDCIFLGVGSSAVHCEARRGAKGIVIAGGIVRDSLAVSNSNNGIQPGNGSVESCAAIGNGGVGISLSDGGSARSCTVSFNVGGISTGQYCHVLDCNSYSNSSSGISLGLGGVARGCTVSKNTSDGISGGDDCRITENTCTGNGGAGIHTTGSYNRIEGNNLADNVGNGIKVDLSTGNLVIRNSVGGGGAYSVPAGNLLGPILGTAAAISTNTNPHANYSY